MNSANRGSIFAGDTILEIENQPINGKEVFASNFSDGSSLLVLRGGLVARPPPAQNVKSLQPQIAHNVSAAAA